MTRGYIAFIGTGGTIAGSSGDATAATEYTAGVVGVESMVAHMKELDAYGPIEPIQFSNIDSADVTADHWLGLARLVQEWVDRDDVDGVVITHGTDTLEETSYFLHLTVHTKKPIVMVGSMRPASALSADGPMNLLEAFQVARHSSSYGKGVLVVMNGTINSARYVQKQHTTGVQAFGSGLVGHMGLVQGGQVQYYYESPFPHTDSSRFSIGKIDGLPTVELIPCYGGVSPRVVEALGSLEAQGYVLEGLGHGNIPTPIQDAVRALPGVVVRSSRVGTGIITGLGLDERIGTIPSGSLHPVKARILLMLALTQTKDREEIKQIFHMY